MTYHAVVCYDVTDDGRRQRLFNHLKTFLEHVQFSVFEGRISARDYGRMLRSIEDCIDPSEDDVRIYRLCPRCREQTELHGQAGRVQTEPEDLIIG
jgi:CRISPR-associated protein Cas2